MKKYNLEFIELTQPAVVNVDGILSYGETFSYNNFSLGNHTIMLNATDSSGVVAEDSINIEVLEEVQAQQNQFNDSSSSQQMTSYIGYNKTVYVDVPKEANELTQSEIAKEEEL